jgi:hypothetical protein
MITVKGCRYSAPGQNEPTPAELDAMGTGIANQQNRPLH